MQTFYHDFTFSSPPHGINDLEGRIEVTLLGGGRPARVNCAPEDVDPGSASDFDLGSIEVIKGYIRDQSGFLYEYAAMPDDAAGAALDQMIRASLNYTEIEDELRDQRKEKVCASFNFHGYAMNGAKT
tara:strand:+ start:2032 stop:2415 length:384 start_codon:yes stop_codon:yes gene_type:complete